jgi:proline iminopeptidase
MSRVTRSISTWMTASTLAALAALAVCGCDRAATRSAPRADRAPPSRSVAGADGDLFHALQRNSWFFPSGEAGIYVTSLGRGARVVTLHGGFGANFEYLVGAVERHIGQREFVLFDQRGSLLSPWPGKLEELTIDDLVADLEKLRLELGEDRLALLAHSMGTLLAYEYLREHPDRVSALILVGALPPRLREQDADDLQAQWNRRGNAMAERPEVKATLAREGVATRPSATAPGRQQALHWRIRFAATNMVRIEHWRRMEGGGARYNGQVGNQLGSTAPKSWDVPASLGARRIPISVIQGDQDFVDPAAAGWSALERAGAPLAPCIDVQVVERAGHNPWADDPDAFAAALDRALARAGC